MRTLIVELGSASSITRGQVVTGDPQTAESAQGIQNGKPALCDFVDNA
jgi:hypothetical protein